jgi:hypothetical protein
VECESEDGDWACIVLLLAGCQFVNGYFVTTNCGLLLSVPDDVTTETGPVVAPGGTVALM